VPLVTTPIWSPLTPGRSPLAGGADTVPVTDLEIRYGAGGYTDLEYRLLLCDDVVPACSPAFLAEHGVAPIPLDGFPHAPLASARRVFLNGSPGLEFPGYRPLPIELAGLPEQAPPLQARWAIQLLLGDQAGYSPLIKPRSPLPSALMT